MARHSTTRPRSTNRCSTPSTNARHAKPSGASETGKPIRISPPNANALNAVRALRTRPTSVQTPTTVALPVRTDSRTGPNAGASVGMALVSVDRLQSDPNCVRNATRAPGHSNAQSASMSRNDRSKPKEASRFDAGWVYGHSSDAEHTRCVSRGVILRKAEKRNAHSGHWPSDSDAASRNASHRVNAAHAPTSTDADHSAMKNEAPNASIATRTNDHIVSSNAKSGVTDSTMCNKPLCVGHLDPTSRQFD